MTANSKPARRERHSGTSNGAADKPKKERKPRATGDVDDELKALADKHRKRSRKLRAEVEKLEAKLSGKRALLDKAEEPLRRIERVLASRDDESLDRDVQTIAERPNAEGTPVEHMPASEAVAS